MIDNSIDGEPERRLTALEELELELAEHDQNQTGLGPRILSSWRDMRAATRRLIEEEPGEHRLLFFVLLSDIVIFFATCLKMIVSPAEFFADNAPLWVGIALMVMLFVRTAAMYVFSGVLWLVARMVGGQGSWKATRVGVFWGALVAAPFGLLMALVTIFISAFEQDFPILKNEWVALPPYWISLVPFIWFISQGLAEAQRFKSNSLWFIVLSGMALVAMLITLFVGSFGH